MYINWWVYFVTDLGYVLQQPSSAGLAKTKTDISKKTSHSYSSRCSAILVCKDKSHIFCCIFMDAPKESHDSCLDCTCNKVKGGMIMHCVVVPKSCVCQYLSVFLNVSVSYLLTFLSKRCSQLIVIYVCHLYALFTT